MDRVLVENVLSVIKHATSKRVVVKGLIKLRTDLVKDHAGIKLFYEQGGIPIMVKFLNKPYEQIIEVALSILGNCCTEMDCCKEVLKYKLSNALLSILKSINNDIIKTRAFRLLGNLAKHDSETLLSNYNISSFTQDICNILVENKNLQVNIMGFRACRILLNRSQFLKSFLQAEGFILIISQLSALLMEKEVPEEPSEQVPLRRGQKPHHRVPREKYFEETMRNLEGSRDGMFDDYEEVQTVFGQQTIKIYAIPEDKQAQELLTELLKCLQTFAECRIPYFKSLQNLYEQRIPNIMWESKSRPALELESLVHLISVDNRWRSSVLSIVANFSKCCYAACWLGQAQAVTTICEYLLANENISYTDRLNCINTLGQLSNDACNRSKIRLSGGLRKIIWILQHSESQTEVSAILYLLNNFQYDELSLILMLRDGLVPVLIRELNTFLTSDNDGRQKSREEKIQISKKRKLSNNDIHSMIRLSKHRVNMWMDCDSPSSSPVQSLSPCSSRSISPAFTSAFPNEEKEDDESYSPVCSDVDDDDDEEEKATSNSNDGLKNIMKLLDTENRAEPVDEDVSDLEETEDFEANEYAAKEDVKNVNTQMLRCTNIDRLENLIFRATLLADKRWELGKPETIIALIKAINTFGTKTAFSGSLSNILMESKFFEQIVCQGIPYQLYQLTKVKQLSHEGFGFLCTLTCVGESYYGKSELERLLESKNTNWQKRAAIAIAYIIKTPNVLHPFLRTGSVLNSLFNTALEDLELNAEAIDALTCMSQNSLNINYIAESEPDMTYELFIEETLLDEKCDMHFVLHSGTKNDKETENDNDCDKICIGFSKQLLCESSDVFNIMLNSDFREGNENEIHLYSYTASGLLYFLNLIKRYANGLPTNMPTQKKTYAILEALEMSRVYIMPEMETALYKLLVIRLDETNCLNVLKWSIQNRHRELNTLAINYYLSSTIATEIKIKLYHQAYNSNMSKQWQDMLQEAVLERCNFACFPSN